MKQLLLSVLALMISYWSGAQAFINYTSDDGLIEGIIYCITEDQDGNLWFTDWSEEQSPGIGKFDGSNFETFGVGEGPTSNTYWKSLSDSNGTLWFGGFLSNTGVDVLSDDNWSNITAADGLLDNEIVDIVEDQFGDIWFGVSGPNLGGISKYDGTSFINYGAGSGIVSELVRCLFYASDNALWIGTTEGVSKFEGNFFTNYTTADGLVANDVWDIHEDTEGNVWFATFLNNVGVSKFDGSTFTTVDSSDGLVNDAVRVISGDEHGTVWFGTNGGVSKLTAEGWTSYTIEDGLSDNNVRSITIDSEGIVWFGTWGGLSKFNPELGVFDNLSQQFKIYPNPASDLVKLQSDVPIVQARIYTLKAQEVMSFENTSITELAVSGLNAGAYWLVVEDAEGNTGFKKLLIN